MTKQLEPRWPIWIWSLQLVPGTFLVIIAVWRFIGQVGTPAITLSALVGGLLWTTATVAVAAWPPARRWLVYRRKDWTLAAASGLFALALLDLGLNLAGLVPSIESQRANSLSYSLGHHTRSRLIPQVSALGSDTVRINGRGFRGPQITGRKPSGLHRIVVLGGSQVFGVLGGQSWPEQLQEQLSGTGHVVEVINAGVPGHDTADSLGKFATDVWTLDPDIVVLCQTWNDIKSFPMINADNPYRQLPPVEPLPWYPDWRIYPRGLDRWLSNSAIYRQFRWGFAQMLYGAEGREVESPLVESIPGDSLGLEQFRLNLELIAELAEQVDAKLAICKQAHLATVDGTGPTQVSARDYGVRNTRIAHRSLMEAFESCNNVIAAVANSRGLRIIDMDSEMTGVSEYFVDGIHFSHAGGSVAARIVAEAITPLL